MPVCCPLPSTCHATCAGSFGGSTRPTQSCRLVVVAHALPTSGIHSRRGDTFPSFWHPSPATLTRPRMVPPATPKYALPAFSRPPPLIPSHILCTAPCLCPHLSLCVISPHLRSSSRPFSPCICTHAWWSLHLSNLLFYSWRAVQARRVRGCTNNSPALLSAVYVTLVTVPVPQHCVVLLTPQAFEPHTPQTLPRTPPRAPKPAGLSLAFAHIPRAQLPAPAHDLRRTSTHTLPHPRALGHRVSKSGRVRGSPRSSFTSRRACDVTHDPDIPIRTQLVLQHHPLPRNACPRDAHAPRV